MAAQLDEAERARWEARVRESAQSWKQAAANAARRPPPGERGPGPGAGAGEALGGAAARWPSQPAMSSRWSIHRAPSGDNPAAHGAAASFVSALTARMRQRRSGSGGGAPHSYEELGDENVERAINIVTGAAFWLRLGQGVEAVCVGELRGALLAHSLLGCPGVATLLGNLCHTVNEGHVPMKQVRRAGRGPHKLLGARCVRRAAAPGAARCAPARRGAGARSAGALWLRPIHTLPHPLSKPTRPNQPTSRGGTLPSGCAHTSKEVGRRRRATHVNRCRRGSSPACPRPRGSSRHAG